MAEFVTLSCPSCGGKLQITPDVDRFACFHCGNEHVVLRSDGVVALKPLQDSLAGLTRATDRTASEMAIQRLRDEITRLEAAKVQVADKLPALRERIAAHDLRKREARTVLIVPFVVGALFLVYRLGQHFQPSSVFLQGLLPFYGQGLCLLTIAALLLGFVLNAFSLVFGNAPKPRRQEVESSIQAVESEMRSIDEAIRQREVELAKHRAAVSLSP